MKYLESNKQICGLIISSLSWFEHCNFVPNIYFSRYFSLFYCPFFVYCILRLTFITSVFQSQPFISNVVFLNPPCQFAIHHRLNTQIHHFECDSTASLFLSWTWAMNCILGHAIWPTNMMYTCHILRFQLIFIFIFIFLHLYF